MKTRYYFLASVSNGTSRAVRVSHSGDSRTDAMRSALRLLDDAGFSVTQIQALSPEQYVSASAVPHASDVDVNPDPASRV